jgi:hypothetical protein
MPESFANRYQTALAAGVTAGAASGTVTSVVGIPAYPFRAIISAEGANADEIVLVTNVAGTTLTWTRAAEAVAGAQVASAHSIGATFTAIVTAVGIGQLRAEAKDIFGGYANGLPVRPMWGDAWLLHGGSVGATARPQIVSGKLTQTVAFPCAGYAQLPLSDSVIRVWARFTLSTYSTSGGVAVLAAWDADINTTWPTIPNAPAHLAINATSAIFGVWSGGAFTQVKDWTFATPLTADATTVHSAEVVIDKHNSTAYVTLPDGVTHVVSHASISAPATFAVWEVYGGAATDTLAAFTEVGAESTAPEDIIDAKVRSTIPTVGTVTAYLQPAGAGHITIPGSTTAIDTTNLRAAFVVGASGGAVADLFGIIQLGAVGDVYWSIMVGATGFGTTVLALNGYTAMLGKNQLCRARIVVPAGTWVPGTTQQIDWAHFVTVTNGGTLLTLNASTGMVASMTVSPL